MNPMEITLLLLLFAAVMFVWEKIPLALTSMIVCLTLVLTGVLDTKVAFNGFVNTNVILFVAMFIVGGALFETGMANKIGGLVTRFLRQDRAPTDHCHHAHRGSAVRCALQHRYCGRPDPGGDRHRGEIGVRPFPTSDAAGLRGGHGRKPDPDRCPREPDCTKRTATDRPGVQFLRVREDRPTHAPVWHRVLCTLRRHRLLPGGNNTADPYDPSHAPKLDYSDVPKWKQYTSLAILLATIAGMVFERSIGIPLHIIGSIGAVLIVLTGVLTEKQAYKVIDSLLAERCRLPLRSSPPAPVRLSQRASWACLAIPHPRSCSWL